MKTLDWLALAMIVTGLMLFGGSLIWIIVETKIESHLLAERTEERFEEIEGKLEELKGRVEFYIQTYEVPGDRA